CFIRNNDVQFVAACDVAKSRLDQFAAKVGGKIDTYSDYRKLLENKDVEAVYIATPDHWHSPIMIAACEAGKDVYCEKPVSNAIEPGLRMIDAARKYNRVVQVGLQQRNWQHFQDCAKLVREGLLGNINHCVMLFGGGGGGGSRQPDEKPGPPPADLDWEMFQGPAPRHEYVPSRQRNWRSYYDYGGGSVTDWGVHLMDATMWYMDADHKSALLTSGMGQYVSTAADPERAPDTFSVVWKFDKFVATFTNAVPPGGEPGMSQSELYGNYFYGQRGMLLVNRYGYEIRPNPQRRIPAGRGPAEMTPAPPPIEAKKDMDAKGMSEDPNSKFGSPTVRHTRNFLDCVKSRQRPACDIEIGFNSSLPCLLANLSIRQGKSFVWDGKTARST
ncbi:MAG TPA: Gfo/Idh/MocA family oxidoreductase, partial [Bryobacteraceae bacterium]|nr:Gfo/Idh/MocA family oxidoreductase [Bryobacteraceae bacterium]